MLVVVAAMSRARASSTRSGKDQSSSRKSSKRGQASISAPSTSELNGGGSDKLPENIEYLSGKCTRQNRCERFSRRFDELAAVVQASSAVLRAQVPPQSLPSNAATAQSDLFPTLQVGYVARAMGLNISNAQVASLVALIEEGGPSTGVVSKASLRLVVVDALLSGVVGGPTLKAAAVSAADIVLSSRLDNHQPFACVPADEATILRAFQAIDREGKGYLEEDELRVAMMTTGEVFSESEIQEMLLVMQDSKSKHIIYADFADILVHE